MSAAQLIVFGIFVFAGCNSRHEQAAPAGGASGVSAGKAAALAMVNDRSQVCMVNNRFMGSAQIPTVVGGKTYFGCCAMCKARLERDATARTAVDPVSGASVDKADAVIGKTTDGGVVYFESAKNLERYASR